VATNITHYQAFVKQLTEKMTNVHKKRMNSFF